MVVLQERGLRRQLRLGTEAGLHLPNEATQQLAVAPPAGGPEMAGHRRLDRLHRHAVHVVHHRRRHRAVVERLPPHRRTLPHPDAGEVVGLGHDPIPVAAAAAGMGSPHLNRRLAHAAVQQRCHVVRRRKRVAPQPRHPGGVEPPGPTVVGVDGADKPFEERRQATGAVAMQCRLVALHDPPGVPRLIIEPDIHADAVQGPVPKATHVQELPGQPLAAGQDLHRRAAAGGIGTQPGLHQHRPLMRCVRQLLQHRRPPLRKERPTLVGADAPQRVIQIPGQGIAALGIPEVQVQQARPGPPAGHQHLVHEGLGSDGLAAVPLVNQRHLPTPVRHQHGAGQIPLGQGQQRLGHDPLAPRIHEHHHLLGPFEPTTHQILIFISAQAADGVAQELTGVVPDLWILAPWLGEVAVGQDPATVASPPDRQHRRAQLPGLAVPHPVEPRHDPTVLGSGPLPVATLGRHHLATAQVKGILALPLHVLPVLLGNRAGLAGALQPFHQVDSLGVLELEAEPVLPQQGPVGIPPAVDGDTIRSLGLDADLVHQPGGKAQQRHAPPRLHVAAQLLPGRLIHAAHGPTPGGGQEHHHVRLAQGQHVLGTLGVAQHLGPQLTHQLVLDAGNLRGRHHLRRRPARDDCPRQQQAGQRNRHQPRAYAGNDSASFLDSRHHRSRGRGVEMGGNPAGFIG